MRSTPQLFCRTLTMPLGRVDDNHLILARSSPRAPRTSPWRTDLGVLALLVVVLFTIFVITLWAGRR
jgi:hypothetical protein